MDSVISKMLCFFINNYHRLRYFRGNLFNYQIKHFNNESNDVKIPDAPTTCCMSGCANCVWIEYAEELLKIFKDGKKSREIILEKVSDPNMRAFLQMELATLSVKEDDPSSTKK